jgi:hypothetical protein
MTQIVSIDRLWHRKLIVRVAELERIQATHNCNIEFPNTEQASDDVTITGPVDTMVHCVDELLVCLFGPGGTRTLLTSIPPPRA